MKRSVYIILALLFAARLSAQGPLGEPQIPVYPTLKDSGSFTMIMVPDPQSYTKFAANQPLFELQTAWIAQNAERLRIAAALFTGDMVEQNNLLTSGGVPNPYNGDQTSRQQWESVSRGLARLDGRIPYIIAQGNHDVGYVAAENRYSSMPEYVYPERNSCFANSLVATGCNYQGINTMENAAFEFHNKTWGDILVIAFEFAPRDEALDWARQLIESEKFRNHKVIVLTHSFLGTSGERIKQESYKLMPRNWAQEVWDKLIYPSKNISLVLCGHTGTPPKIDSSDSIDYRSTAAYRVDKAADGRNIPQMMFNSQNGDGDWNGNGGDCCVQRHDYGTFLVRYRRYQRLSDPGFLILRDSSFAGMERQTRSRVFFTSYGMGNFGKPLIPAGDS